MKKFLQKIMLGCALLLPSGLFGQTVTVTANMKTIFAGNQSTKSQACFSLVDANGNPINNPRVSSGVLPNTQNVCVSPDGTGLISTTLYANDAISPTGSLWSVAYLFNGKVAHGDVYQFLQADGSENLNNKVGINVPAIVTPPTGDTTYARLDGGNLPFTGNVPFPNGIITALGVLEWGSSSYATPDTGLSRCGAGILCVGNGTQGDTSGTVKTTRYTGLAAGGQSGAAFVAQSTTPGSSWQATGAGVDQKWWDCIVSGNTTFTCRTVNDANNSAVQWVTVTRGAGTAVSSIAFGAGGGTQTLPVTTGTLARTSGDTFTSTTLTSPTVTNPTTTGTDSGVETMQSKTLGGAGSTAPFTVYNRMKVGQGTALATTDFSISAGWGTTASVSAVVGTDARFRVSVASAGTGQAVNPTFTITFHDGTWTNVPICNPVSVANVAPLVSGIVETTTSATAMTWLFPGTPVAGNTYIFNVDCQGR